MARNLRGRNSREATAAEDLRARLPRTGSDTNRLLFFAKGGAGDQPAHTQPLRGPAHSKLAQAVGGLAFDHQDSSEDGCGTHDSGGDTTALPLVGAQREDFIGRRAQALP